jgi:hypothetical protein
MSEVIEVSTIKVNDEALSKLIDERIEKKVSDTVSAEIEDYIRFSFNFEEHIEDAVHDIVRSILEEILNDVSPNSLCIMGENFRDAIEIVLINHLDLSELLKSSKESLVRKAYEKGLKHIAESNDKDRSNNDLLG